VVEAAVIVVSILLAFWIDAAWDLRQDRNVAVEQLTAVHSELPEIAAIVERYLERCPRSVQAARDLISQMGSQPISVAPDSLAMQVSTILQSTPPMLQGAAFEAMVSSGQLAAAASLELQRALREWASTLEERARRRLLAADQLEELMGYLESAGAMAYLHRGSRIEAMSADFPLDVGRLLADPVLGGIVGSAGIRLGQVCADDRSFRLPQLREVIKQVESELPGAAP
jgi:hypothetical protein